MALQAIKKTNISEQVFKQLKQQLLDGTWTPGQKLPSENELCAAFGVSRITVRQALQKLTVLGLLETRLGEGSFVREFTPGHYMNEMIPAIYLGASSVEEIFEFRVIMEVEVAGIAARKATDADIERLSESLKKMAETRGDIQTYTKEDFRFHMILAEISGNSLVIHLMGLLTDVLEGAIQDVTRTIGVDSGMKYHNLILEAIKIHNYDMAKTVMREHVEISLKNFQERSALSS